MSRELSAIRRRVEAGERLGEADALALLRSADLLAVGELASLSNRRKNGNRVFYNVNRHVNPTNVCVNRCRFCAFSRSPDEKGAYTLTADEMLERAACAEAAGATELHVVGGLHPDLPLAWYLEVIAEIRRRHPGLHVKGFTAVEIDHLARISGGSAEEVLRRLLAAGLGSLPGGGAEILAEETRRRICPEKITGTRWLEIMGIAHGLGLRSNATMLYGHLETPEDRVEHMARLRALQDRTGGFQAFIPLAFQPKNSDLARGASTTGYDDLKTLAVGRLFLDNFDHVKAYWVMLGEKIAQVSLHFGVDDLDGTVVEEKIAHDAGATSAEALGRDELVALIVGADKEAVERDTLYRPVRRAECRVPSAACASPGEAAHGARNTQRVGRGEALRLLREEEFLSLGRRADEARERLHPEGFATFVVDRNVNYTNVCTCQCRFCAFYRKPGDAEGYVLSHEEIFGKIQELVDRGGTQLLMQGGLHPDLRIEWFEELFREMKRRFPGVQNHSLSPAEVIHVGRVSALGLEETLDRLHAAGLDSIPGGGAEVLVDRVRREISPNKIGWRDWAAVMEAAHRRAMPTTATLMFGSTETDEDLVEHLLRVRDLQDRSPGFTAFIPWTFQPTHTELGRATGLRPAGAVRYLRVLAVARLVLDNVPNVQASWVTQGEKVAQVALRFGANDLGSTMLEENVVAAAGVRFRIEQERLVELIRDAGFRPAQRTTTYGLVREL